MIHIVLVLRVTVPIILVEPSKEFDMISEIEPSTSLLSSSRLIVVKVSLTGTLIPLSTSAGVVLALLWKLLTITTLVFVCVMFEITVE